MTVITSPYVNVNQGNIVLDADEKEALNRKCNQKIETLALQADKANATSLLCLKVQYKLKPTPEIQKQIDGIKVALGSKANDIDDSIFNLSNELVAEVVLERKKRFISQRGKEAPADSAGIERMYKQCLEEDKRAKKIEVVNAWSQSKDIDDYDRCEELQETAANLE